MKLQDYPRATRPVRELWVMQVPVISTGHITKSDAETLDEDSHCRVLLFPASEDGYLIYIGEGTDERWMNNPGLSDALKAVLTNLQSLGYTYVRFDSAGDDFTDLPTFNW